MCQLTSKALSALQEWQQEDFDKTKAEVIVSLHQVLLRCQRQDRTLWPEAVTTAFQSAISPVPCAASAGAATALETATVAAQRNGSPHQIASGHADVESQDVFGQLCCGNW